MNLNKPAFWDSKQVSLWAILLLPITALYCLILAARRVIKNPKKFNIKTICIGNIYLGGTGKTPLTIKMASLLESKFNLVIVKKEYTDQKDEIAMLRQSCKVITHKSRISAIEQAVKENYNLAIMDDGFQDEDIKKDISILCFSSAQSVGNGFIIPSGPLRESLDRIKCSDIVFINGDLNPDLEKKIKSYKQDIKIFYSAYHLLNANYFKVKNYFAFSGIGNNINFLNLLKKNKINISGYKFFPDHYEYNDHEIDKLKNHAQKNKLHLLTTEKDYLRLGEKNKKNIEHCKIQLIINDEEKLVKQIMSYENN